MITAVNPPTNLAKGASGQYDSVTVRYASTLSLSGKQLFFNPALWVSAYEIETSLPTAGYRVNYPFSPQTIDFQLIPAANSQTQLNLRAELTVINNKTFEVTLYFVHFADINDFITNTNIPALTRVLNRQISGNSVYNEQKLMVFRVAYQSGSNLHQAYTDINYQAGHYNRSINNGPPIAPGIIQLSRGANPVTNFSQVENTKVNFAVNTTDLVFHEYFGGIIQVNAVGGGNYWNATNMMYARLSNVKNSVEQISNTAILSPQQISQVGGGYSGSFVLDKAYFSGTGSYRVFVAVRIGDRWQSYITNEIGVSENYETTFGSTTAQWTLNSQIFPDCLQGVQSGQSVEICFEVDKNDYNTNLGLNGVGGSFDSNFVSVNILLLDGIPISNQIPTGSPYPVIISQDSNFHTTCTGFPVPAAWEGENKFFAAVYTFNVPTPQGTIVDQIVKYAQLGVTDPDQSGAGNLSLISVLDELGNPIPILCEDFEGDIIVTVQNDTGVADIDLSLQWTVHEFGNILNTYNNSIVSSDSAFSSGEATITIDPSLLPLGTEICITLIVEGSSDPIVCDPGNFVGTVYSTNVLPDILNYALAYDFSGFPGYENATVTHINLDGVLEVIEPPTNNGVIQFSQLNETNQPFHILSASFFIVVNAGGCIYEFCFDILTIVPADGFSQDVSTEVQPGANECTPPELEGGCQDQDLGITTECNEGVVTATLTGTPTGVITDVLEYNFDGSETWLAYTVPVEVEPTDEICSTYFKRTVTLTDCDPVIIYAVQDFCCPATECPDFECEPLETYDPDLNELELSIECGSEITDSILIEYSIDGGVNYIEYTVPIDMTGVESVMWRMVVQFDASYPECDPNIFEYEGEFSLEGENPNLCISSPTLEATFLNGCHSATTGGDVYFVATDTVYYSTNLGLTWTEYTSGEICGANVVIWKRIVTYSNDCPKSCIVKASADPCCSVSPCEYECYFNFLYDSAEGCAMNGIEVIGCGTGETVGDILFISNLEPTNENFDEFGTVYNNDVLTCTEVSSWHFRALVTKENCPNKYIYASFDCDTCTEDGDVTPPTEDLNITYWGPLAD